METTRMVGESAGSGSPPIGAPATSYARASLILGILGIAGILFFGGRFVFFEPITDGGFSTATAEAVAGLVILLTVPNMLAAAFGAVATRYGPGDSTEPATVGMLLGTVGLTMFAALAFLQGIRTFHEDLSWVTVRLPWFAATALNGGLAVWAWSGSRGAGSPGSPFVADVNELIQRLAATGIRLSDLQHTDEPLTLEYASGSLDDENVLVATFEDREAQHDWLAAARAGGGAFVTGRTWVVAVEELSTARRIAAAIGGQIKR